MADQPRRLAIVVSELRVAVPRADYDQVQDNVRTRGLKLVDDPTTEARVGAVIVAQRVVDLDLSHVPSRLGDRDADPASRARLAMADQLDSATLSEVARALNRGMKYQAEGGPPRRTWLKVFSTRLVPTGYELHVRDERDADRQLDLLAEVSPTWSRDEITIKPTLGWEGYGTA
jgi:hypothetical protein